MRERKLPKPAVRQRSARLGSTNGAKQFGGIKLSEMKRLKQLEEENGKLKKIFADLSLDKEMLLDVIKRKL